MRTHRRDNVCVYANNNNNNKNYIIIIVIMLIVLLLWFDTLFYFYLLCTYHVSITYSFCLFCCSFIFIFEQLF